MTIDISVDDMNRELDDSREEVDPCLETVDTERLTDVGNARRLVRRFAGSIRYCPEVGWLTWDGSRWIADNRGRVREMAKAVAQDLHDEADAARQELADYLAGGGDKDSEEGKRIAARVKRLMGWALASEGASKQRAMCDLAQSDPQVVVERGDFDTEPELLNLRDCVVNLRTGDRLEHTPKRLMMHRAEAAYARVPKGKTYRDVAPRFMDFLAKVTCGDLELAAYLQRAVGVSMCGNGPKNKLFICHGMGANGKSTFIGLISRILGSYCVNIRVKALLETGGFDQIPVDIARLAGARMCTMAEPSAGDQLASGIVKELLGEAVMTARFMRKDPFTFTPCCSPWLSCNHKLIVRDNSDGTWRRMSLLAWGHRFEERDQIENFDALLLREEREGIFAWMIDGAMEYLANGLQPPASVTAAVAAYREEMDLLAEFLTEYTERGTTPEYVTAYRDAWEAFKEWAKDYGEDARKWNPKRFTRELSDRGIKRSASKANGQPLVGIKLIRMANSGKPMPPVPGWMSELPPPGDPPPGRSRHWTEGDDN